MSAAAKPLVAGNWKMNLRVPTARKLAEEIVRAAAAHPGPDVAVFPAFPHLGAVGDVLRGSRVALGAQTCHDREDGPHTGAVSAEMLADLGVSIVLCGHSERRRAGETDEIVGARVRAALRAGLRPLLCVGESLTEREEHRTDEVLRRQTATALELVLPADLSRLDVAYEPVWAIGTGRTAASETAVEAHRVVRDVLITRFGAVGASPRILYGGSVKPSNAAELMTSEGVGGVLVGGASLEAQAFLSILASAPRELSGAVRS